ncbi:hypothetical protein ACIBBB_00405 [Streptomyces sp. NPDC051217]|uniref:hypothetical protein n=1 Tax=Streptomyces sp. NPDC051217 TaxID=3365644 RepID=UPI003795D526
MPRELRAASVLLYFLFGVTVLGTTGALTAAASVDAVDGWALGLLLYASAPGVAALVLARKTWAGGVRVRWALIAVQVWLIVGALGTLGQGSGRGVTQLVVPVAVTVLIFRRESREWFALPKSERAERRPFRLARMIKWRTDGGQSATEYVGLIVLVAAIVTGLVATGVGGQISGGLRSAVCGITGSACGGDGADTGAAAEGGTEGGAGGSGRDHSADGAYGPGEEPGDPYERTDIHDDDGAYDPALRDPDGTYEGGEREDGEEGGDGDDGGESCTSGFGAFLDCAGEEVGGAFEGVVIDGIGGDLSDGWDTITDPGAAIEDVVDYGRDLGEQWLDDAEGAADRWSGGDYLGAIGDWGEASLNLGLTVLDDSFVGDEVREAWNNGDYGQAVGLFGWNVGSSFIPYYGQARWADRLGGGSDRDTPDSDQDVPDGESAPDSDQPDERPDQPPGEAVDPEHVAELEENGVRFSPEDLVRTARDRDGRVIFLEQGNERAGLTHVMQHAPEFEQQGIARDDIADFVVEAAAEGEIVGYQGSGTGRPIYELTYQGRTQRVAVTVGSNGFIVGANPRSLPDD